MDPKKVFLLPGEYFAGRQPHMVATLLGSCVAVCLYNPKKKFGGMNHYLLPEPISNSKDTGRFGTTSIRALLNLVRRLDPDNNPLKAMIFGGGNVVSVITSGSGIGKNNIEVARQVLARENIPVTHEQVGGENGVKLHYRNWDNHISVRKVEKSIMTLALEEKRKDLSKRKFRVLIVDDAPLVRTIMTRAINATPDMEVVGQAQDAFEARQMLLELRPDVMTLDIIMPKMDGVNFLRRVMAHFPVPTVICSTIAQKGSQVRQNAFQAGAVDVIDKSELNLYQGDAHLSKFLGEVLRKAAMTMVRKKVA